MSQIERCSITFLMNVLRVGGPISYEARPSGCFQPDSSATGERERARKKAWQSERVCVCERERESERARVSVRVRESARERKRDRARVSE